MAMTPHLDLMETDAGRRGLILVSGFALLVHAGTESRAALADAIKLAAAISGIPADALDTYAHYTFAFLESAAMDQPGPAPCQSAGHEGAEK